jgi:hypothetical protein
MTDARRQLIAVAPSALLGIAAVALSSMVDPAPLRVPLQVASVLALIVATWRACTVDATAAEEEQHPAVTPIALERITGDRRRPTIDRDTGLLADWYFRLRLEEELARAQRYDQRFTLLRMDVAEGHVAYDGIGSALRASLRGVDLAGTLGNTTCVLLPNTDRISAAPVIDRLRALSPTGELTVVECPTEASTLAAALGEEQWMITQSSWPDVSAA